MLWPLVSRLRAFRGLDTLSALIVSLEVADFTRFERAVQLGSWLGLVPSRQQSGEQDVHGSITKTGSKYARRILVEAAWHYARPPRIGTKLAERHDGLPDHVLQIAWRAQHRPAPHPQTDAGSQEAGQRDHRRVRARAVLPSLGARHRPITPTDSPPARVGRRRAPKSAGTRDASMGSPNQATPAFRQASAGDEIRDLGCQPPHMRLTDVEDALGASPPEPQTHHAPQTGATISAAYLTNVPPYETRIWRHVVAGAV
jgi:Transposase IS116/IS110/IS902 family